MAWPQRDEEADGARRADDLRPPALDATPDAAGDGRSEDDGHREHLREQVDVLPRLHRVGEVGHVEAEQRDADGAEGPIAVVDDAPFFESTIVAKRTARVNANITK